MDTSSTAIQDRYSDDVAHCYGCGKLNEAGLQIKTYQHGDETVTRFKPETHHTALPGYVYGGLLASLIDCHGIATAAADAERQVEGDPSGREAPRYVTASLQVDFLRPTPLGATLEIRGRAIERSSRKVVVRVGVYADDLLCVEGTVVGVRMPEHLKRA